MADRPPESFGPRVGERFHPSARGGAICARRRASQGPCKKLYIIHRISQVGVRVDDAAGFPRATEGRRPHGQRDIVVFLVCSLRACYFGLPTPRPTTAPPTHTLNPPFFQAPPSTPHIIVRTQHRYSPRLYHMQLVARRLSTSHAEALTQRGERKRYSRLFSS